MTAQNTKRYTKKSPNRGAHLEQYKWKPGQPSPNPGGRPKKLTKELEKQLWDKVPGDPKGRSYAQVFISQVIARSITKSDILAKEIFDRVEGKASLSEEDQAAASRSVQIIVLDVPRPDRSNIVNVKPAIPHLPPINGKNGDK